MTRLWIVKVFGIPVALLSILFYSLTMFSIQDLDEIVLFLCMVALLCLFVGLLWPSTFQQFFEGVQTRMHIAKVFGVIATTFLLLFAFSLPLLEIHRLVRLQKAATDREHILSSTSIQQPGQSAQVRVYPLHVGNTIVTYGQFYGGLSGWEGLGGYFQTLVNKDRIIVPIYAYLIDHSEHGLMMVDAGICWEQAHDHDQYYNSNPLARLLSDREEYILPAEQELEVQVRRLGYQLNDIKTVFMTHVHDDHAGGLRSLPDAKVVLGKADWEEGTLYPHSFEFVQDDLEFLTYDSGPYHNFSSSQDFFGDGSVILLPTPGHSPGHTMMVLQMDGYQTLFVGDHLYTLRHLAVDEVRQMTIGGEATTSQVQGIHAVQELRKDFPDMVLLFAHDHSDYQFQYIEPLLTDGSFSLDDRQKIKNYEKGVFTDNWRLLPGNTPFFVPATANSKTGVVDFR